MSRLSKLVLNRELVFKSSNIFISLKKSNPEVLNTLFHQVLQKKIWEELIIKVIIIIFMAMANIEVERENMELIRSQVQASMADPLEIEVIESTLFVDVTEPTGIVLYDANQASAFFDIIQQEIGRTWYSSQL